MVHDVELEVAVRERREALEGRQAAHIAAVSLPLRARRAVGAMFVRIGKWIAGEARPREGLAESARSWRAAGS